MCVTDQDVCVVQIPWKLLIPSLPPTPYTALWVKVAEDKQEAGQCDTWGMEGDVRKEERVLSFPS